MPHEPQTPTQVPAGWPMPGSPDWAALVAEYDAFGPWLLRVTTPDEVPPLFRPWAAAPATTEIMLKVPRNVVRRDTRVGADLYDHLLWVCGGTFTQLSRDPAGEGGVLRREVPLSAVVAVEDSAELLDAVLTLRLEDGGALSVRYTGTSRPVMGELVAAVRRSWRPDAVQDRPVEPPTRGAVGTVPRAVELGLTDLGEDVALVTEQRDLVRAEPGLSLIGAHGRRRIERIEPGFVDRLREWLTPSVLNGAVVCADAHELVVLHRREWVPRTRRPELSMVRTIVSLDRVRRRPARAEVRATAYAGVSELVVGQGAARLLVPSGGEVERGVLGLLTPGVGCETLEP